MHPQFLITSMPMNCLRIKFIVSLFLISNAVLAQEPEQILSETDIQMLEEPQVSYISDQFYVPLRSSPCPRCKIIHKGLKSGTQLTVLGFQEDWSLVSTNSGYEGWIRNQHITDTEIARDLLALESARLIELEKQNKLLEEDASRAVILIKELRENIAEIKANRTAMAKELTTIKNISAKELTLHEQNQILVKHNHLLQEERDVLRANVDDLRDNKRNESFLYGGFVAFLGALLAAIIPRIRRRKRLSEWG